MNGNFHLMALTGIGSLKSAISALKRGFIFLFMVLTIKASMDVKQYPFHRVLIMADWCGWAQCKHIKLQTKPVTRKNGRWKNLRTYTRMYVHIHLSAVKNSTLLFNCTPLFFIFLHFLPILARQEVMLSLLFENYKSLA